METIEITLEDGTSVRWVIPTSDQTDEVIRMITSLLGAPDTKE